MQQYTWSFDGDAEIWENENYDTIEECLEDAREAIIEDRRINGEFFDDPEYVYVGEVKDFVPSVDALSVLERLEDQASDELGFIGQDWDAYDYTMKEEIQELEDAFTSVLHDWLRKHGRYPNMWSVDNIKQHQL